MHRADTCAGEHRNRALNAHGHIDCDTVPFANAKGLERASHALNLRQQRGVGNPARIIEAKTDAVREEVASKMGFSAYGVTQNDDPLSQAIRGLIDYTAEQDKQIAMLWQALEKLSQGAVNAADCVPKDASKNIHADIEKLNKLID